MRRRFFGKELLRELPTAVGIAFDLAGTGVVAGVGATHGDALLAALARLRVTGS